jgi:hypothetical protein
MSEIVGCGNPDFQAGSGTKTHEFTTEASRPYHKLNFRHPIPYTVHPVAHTPAACPLEGEPLADVQEAKGRTSAAPALTAEVVPPQAIAA